MSWLSDAVESKPGQIAQAVVAPFYNPMQVAKTGNGILTGDWGTGGGGGGGGVSGGAPQAPYTPIALPPSMIPMPGAIPGMPPMSFDPLLSPANILRSGQDMMRLSQTPVDPTKFILPGVQELMAKGVNDQLNINRSNATSDFNARGMTGSSTEIGTLTRDLPAAANQALQEGTLKLLQTAYPLAMQDKQNIIDTVMKTTSLTTQVRQMIGDEQFKMLSLQQQQEVANQDVQLKLKLADINMRYQVEIANAQLAVSAANNDADRRAAQQQFDYLQSERTKEREKSFLTSLTTLAGAGIGGMKGGVKGAMVGAMVGKEAGNGAADGGLSSGFSSLFLMP